MTEFKKGDKVRWSSHGGEAHGVVERKLTSETSVNGHKVAASADAPQYLIKTDNGSEAAHKPDALRKG